MVHHHKVECLVKRLDCSVVVQVKVTKKFTVPVNGHLDNISSAAELSVTKLGMVRQHYGPESCKKIGFLSPSSGSQLGLIWSDMTFSSTCAELLIFLQPNFIGWYISISWSALFLKLKIDLQKIRTEGHNDPLNYRSIGNTECSYDEIGLLSSWSQTVYPRQWE